jgi:hypothetical protein
VGKDSYFRGVAEMVSPIYHKKHWFESCEDLSGSFHVRWHIVLIMFLVQCYGMFLIEREQACSKLTEIIQTIDLLI